MSLPLMYVFYKPKSLPHFGMLIHTNEVVVLLGRREPPRSCGWIIYTIQGLIFTIPLAIVLTIVAFCEDNKGKKDQPTASTRYLSYGGRIQDLDTMDIPHSGYSAAERRAEYMRRGQSPSGFINGVYNDQNRPRNVPYYDGNRDWDADA